MLLFEANEETRSIIDYSIAVFKWKERLSGFEELAAYLAGLCFTKVIVQTGRKFEELLRKHELGKDLEVDECINFLSRKQQIDSDLERELRILNRIRNRIMHVGAKSVNVKDVERVLRKTCSLVDICYEEELEKKDFEDVLAFGDRVEPLKPFEKIVASDFDDFSGLYDKCHGLKVKIQEELVNSGELGLLPEEISEFVPTTGGIWLPWVTQKTPPERAHIHRATLGVTFTPNNIRMGLDFGSRAHRFKLKYYKLLLGRILEEDIRRLWLSDKRYCFYDTFWYYNIRNRRSLEWYLRDTEMQRIRDALKKVEMLNGKPMTSHELLVGKIIDARNRESKGFHKTLEILVKEVCNVFNDIRPILTNIES